MILKKSFSSISLFLEGSFWEGCVGSHTGKADGGDISIALVQDDILSEIVLAIQNHADGTIAGLEFLVKRCQLSDVISALSVLEEFDVEIFVVVQIVAVERVDNHFAQFIQHLVADSPLVGNDTRFAVVDEQDSGLGRLVLPA